MKNKIILTVLFIITLLPMLFNWFSDASGSIVIKGIVVLFNPITIIAILVYIFSIWYKNANKISNRLAVVSLISIILLEAYTYFDWMFKVASGVVTYQYIHLGFIIGFQISILMLAIHLRMNNKKDINKK